MADRPTNTGAEKRGHRSESLAAWWLRLKGYRILGRRVKTHAGEIDLVALRPSARSVLSRSRRGRWRATPPKRWRREQRTRIARAASLYLASRPGLARRGARFDIVAIAPRLPQAFAGRLAAG